MEGKTLLALPLACCILRKALWVSSKSTLHISVMWCPGHTVWNHPPQAGSCCCGWGKIAMAAAAGLSSWGRSCCSTWGNFTQATAAGPSRGSPATLAVAISPWLWQQDLLLASQLRKPRGHMRLCHCGWDNYSRAVALGALQQTPACLPDLGSHGRGRMCASIVRDTVVPPSERRPWQALYCTPGKMHMMYTCAGAQVIWTLKKKHLKSLTSALSSSLESKERESEWHDGRTSLLINCRVSSSCGCKAVWASRWNVFSGSS